MNKHLNNWMDEAEGLPINTTNSNIEKELRRQGYRPEQLMDNKGEHFIGWSKNQLCTRDK